MAREQVKKEIKQEKQDGKRKRVFKGRKPTPRSWTKDEKALLLTYAIKAAKSAVPTIAKDEGFQGRPIPAIHGKLDGMLKQWLKTTGKLDLMGKSEGGSDKKLKTE